MQSRPEPLAKFLLDPPLCPLRFHIQIQAHQHDHSQGEQTSEQEEDDSTTFSHVERYPVRV
jgi:hypothetical protein